MSKTSDHHDAPKTDKAKAREKQSDEAELDEALEETFPASDPSSVTAPGRRFTGAEEPGKSHSGSKR